jgi:hypothetical protein
LATSLAVLLLLHLLARREEHHRHCSRRSNCSSSSRVDRGFPIWKAVGMLATRFLLGVFAILPGKRLHTFAGSYTINVTGRLGEIYSALQ